LDDLTVARWQPLRSRPSLADGWPAARDVKEAEPFLVGEVDGDTTYDALAAGDSALFMHFQSDVRDSDGALDFAAQYGFLGAPVTERVLLAGGRIYVGDSLATWLNEAEGMRRAVALWDAIRTRSRRAMLRDPHVAALARPVSALSQSIPIHLSTVPDAEIHGYALVTLARLTNRGLQAPIDRYEAQVGPELRVEEDRLAFRVVGRTLLGDLWLQLALAVGGDKRFRQCPRDGRWWEIHRDIARTNKVYCSDACKQAAYRERKAGRAKG
jgi:hypothetical protein